MATDYERIIRNLIDFFDLSGRIVIAVGREGAVIEYGRTAAKVIAIDQDPEALAALRDKLGQAGLADKFALVQSAFLDFLDKADVVLFEFCLHEMPRSVGRPGPCRTLAPAVVVMDHWPGSEWAFMTAEEDKATAACLDRILSAGENRFVRGQQGFAALGSSGRRSIARRKVTGPDREVQGLSDISIP